MLKFFTAFFILATGVCGQVDNRTPETTSPDAGLTIEYIANEGISISSGSTRILLDAIHRRYKPAYAFTPEAMLAKIESARYPYNKINLILVSHYHLDHFHPESIASHLANNNRAMLISSDQVIDETLKSRDELAKTSGKKG